MVSDTKFSYKAHLREHMQMPTQGNYVGCDICGSKILDISILKRHMHIHTEAKQFCWDICLLKFSQNSNMK